ncbi:hypothetical protein CROQUDRAFT_700049 [Cronartium quercuum f. sp. fusiforme G11]|uniref:Uncharacterized protein n=1 Tax=Cronartium quercuum f. sp. fusiforme G11 TaxID=708437 RepID=A0A9P6NMU5_9BASI|nr:hypothetical protein CROQUDRAFT_700049 [Cronartium quercuum f. sp. fusiforme G11]
MRIAANLLVLNLAILLLIFDIMTFLYFKRLRTKLELQAEPPSEDNLLISSICLGVVAGLMGLASLLEGYSDRPPWMYTRDNHEGEQAMPPPPGQTPYNTM